MGGLLTGAPGGTSGLAHPRAASAGACALPSKVRAWSAAVEEVDAGTRLDAGCAQLLPVLRPATRPRRGVGPVVHDTFHHDRRGEPLHAGQAGKFLVTQGLVGG